MAKHRNGELRTVPHTAAAAISADDVIVKGVIDGKKSTVGVAMKDMDSGSTYEGAVAVAGAFEFAKVSAAVIKAGESVNWDSSESAVDDNAHTTGAGDVAEFGKALEDKGNGDTTILVEISEPGSYDAA